VFAQNHQGRKTPRGRGESPWENNGGGGSPTLFTSRELWARNRENEQTGAVVGEYSFVVGVREKAQSFRGYKPMGGKVKRGGSKDGGGSVRGV